MMNKNLKSKTAVLRQHDVKAADKPPLRHPELYKTNRRSVSEPACIRSRRCFRIYPFYKKPSSTLNKTLSIGQSVNNIQLLNIYKNDVNVVNRRENLCPAGCKRTKPAFTLAEVLITLVIIGIVAAMTIPTLISKYNEKRTVVQLNKVYSVLSQALQLATLDYGTPDNWGQYTYDADENDDTAESGIRIRRSPELFVEKMVLLKKCGFESKGCFGTSYKTLAGSSERDFENLNNRYYKVILSDGTSIAIEGYEENSCKTDTSNCGEIWVDINGKNEPNTVGKDLFLFTYTRNGICPYGYNKTTLPLKSTSCKSSSSGYDCTAWVLTFDNMDYLYCDDLSWAGKTKCN